MRKNPRALRILTAAMAAVMLLSVSFPASAEEAEPLSRILSDYTGAGTVIAVIDAGFDPAHPAFGTDPANPRLGERDVTNTLGEAYADAYLSRKIPLALDYAGTGRAPTPDAALIGPDTDVTGLSDRGTSAASLAAGCYFGKGDTENGDGTVTHDGDFFGAAPDAQLLLMKAAPDHSSTLSGDAAAAAIHDAVRLGADVICAALTDAVLTEKTEEALRAAAAAGIPVFTGAGDMTDAMRRALTGLSASVADRGTLTDAASLPGVIAVGAAADPYSGLTSFTAGEREIFYTDSTAEYLGRPFAEFFAGGAVPLAAIPGIGRPADYEGLDAAGKIAVVIRGEIPFAEKAQYAAEAGAVGLIVVNTEETTTRMALTGTKIPAVMVTLTDGAYLTDGVAEITLAAAVPRPADFSAVGLTADFSAAPAYLVAGENLTAAVRAGYDSRSGTHYAAARAAGFCAAAAEYLRRSGRSERSAPDLLAAAAIPLYEGGVPLSPRIAGAGLLTADAALPGTLIRGDAAGSVTVADPGNPNTVTALLRITNTDTRVKRYTLTADITTDEVDEDGILTGKSVRAPSLYVTAGMSGENLADGGKAVISVAPGDTESLYLRISVSYEARKYQLLYAPYGFYLDTLLTLTEQPLTPGISGPTITPAEPAAMGERITHAVTLFWGDLSLAPLSDTTVYEKGEPILQHTSLAVFSADAGLTLPIGTADPFGAGEYDGSFNIVSPRMLKDGRLELRLTALRRIDAVTVRFLDADGRLLTERQIGPVEKFIKSGGRAVLPLWDFRAPDEPEYVFPDGTYFCEIRLSSMDGASVQYLGFTVRADSEKPRLTDPAFVKEEDGRILLTVNAADNAALRSVTAYDLSRSYQAAVPVPVSGEKDVSCTFDITAYDGDGPLYVEVTDYAGQYTVLRFTEETVRAAVGGAP